MTEAELLAAWLASLAGRRPRGHGRIDPVRAWGLRCKGLSWPEVTWRLGTRRNGQGFKVGSVIYAVHRWRMGLDRRSPQPTKMRYVRKRRSAPFVRHRFHG
jgi:hypothetical protein